MTSDRRRTLLALLVPLAIGAAVRITVAAQTFPTGPVGDEYYYAMVAANLSQDRGHRDARDNRATHPPLHAWLLSQAIPPGDEVAELPPAQLARLLARRDLLTRPGVVDFLGGMVQLQVVLGIVLVGLIAGLGIALFDRRTGVVAGLLAAAHPVLVAHSHDLWSETIFTTLLVGALFTAVWARRARSFAAAAATGVLLGAAALARETAVPAGAAIALWWCVAAPAGERRAALGRGALLALFAALVILPWTWRNYHTFDRFVPIATTGWYALSYGNTFESPGWRRPYGPAQAGVKQEYLARRDEIGNMGWAREHALERIRAEQPAWLLKKTLRNVPMLLNPESHLTYKLREGAYGAPSEQAVRIVTAYALAFYVLLMTAGILGVAGDRDRARARLPILVLGAVLALHILSSAEPRYRVPWLPLVMVFASYTLVHPREIARSLRGIRLKSAGVALFFFWAICVPFYFQYYGFGR